MKTILTTEVFVTWLAKLKDRQAIARVQARIDRAEDGNFGDCAPVGKVSLRCGFTMVRVIEFISRNVGWQS